MPETNEMKDMTLPLDDYNRLMDAALSLADYNRLIEDGGTDKEVERIWHEIGVRDGFYPSTVDWLYPSNKFRARELNKFTSIDDIDQGWTFNDWMTGWGPGELWRIRLNRRITPLESKRLTPRLNAFASAPTFDEMIVLFITLCDKDLEIVKCRKRGDTGQIITATEIKDKWQPVWPEPEDLEVSS